MGAGVGKVGILGQLVAALLPVGDLPEQCAALNRTNINVQLLTIEAAMTRSRDKIYQAAMMDPHLQSELSIDDFVSLCDDLIVAHEGWLPEYH